jgi:DNA polymerase I-like protein with 3'-5' exonuclease and polymerase domains
MSKSKLNVIDSVEGVEELYSYLLQHDVISYDTETTGVLRDSEIIGFSVCAEETKAFYVVLKVWDVDNQSLVDIGTKAAAIKIIELLKTKLLICHNAVFDCSITESYFRVSLMDSLMVDTMVAAHLVNENRRIGLKELGKELYGDDADNESKLMKASVEANGGCLTKKNFEMFKADPYLMGKYGAQDALLTFKLYIDLLSSLEDEGLTDFFLHDESMPLLKGPTYELNTVGIKVDVQKLQSLKKTLQAECLVHMDIIASEIRPYVLEKWPGAAKKNTFNIMSNVQLSWLVYGQLKLEFGQLTDGGKAIAKTLGLKVYTATEKRKFIETLLARAGEPMSADGKKKMPEPWKLIKTDKVIIQKHASRYKFLGEYLHFSRKQKLIKTYIDGTVSKVQYGVIYPSFMQHGTTSGRYASKNPNFQNLPREDKRIKECMVSRPGKSFVGADFSQLEPRVFASFSQDANLLKAFDGTNDFYSVIGMRVYGKDDCEPQKDGSPDAFGVKYKKLRDLSKVIALASVYGASAFQLAKTTGKSVDETQMDINKYFAEFEGVARFMLESHELAKRDGFVTNLFGRKRRMPDAKKINQIYGDQDHGDYPYEVRSMLNLSTNHRVQSTGASICNRAMIAFYHDVRVAEIKDCHVIAQIHDEIIVECRDEDAENVAILLQNAMENTVTLPGVKLEAIPTIGKTLAALK